MSPLLRAVAVIRALRPSAGPGDTVTRALGLGKALAMLAAAIAVVPLLVIVTVVSVFSQDAKKLNEACGVGEQIATKPTPAGFGTVLAPGWTLRGPASTFGPPLERGGPTAYGSTSRAPGIALNPNGGAGWNDALARSLAGRWFSVHLAGRRASLQVIDKGPSAIGRAGPRRVDVTGAGALRMRLDPFHFPTDATARVVMLAGPPRHRVDRGTGAGTLQGLTPTTALTVGPVDPAAPEELPPLDCDALMRGELPLRLVPGDRARLLPDGTAAAPKSAPRVVRQMIAAGNELAGRPYALGAGHGVSLDRLSPAYDCSSAVEYLLRAGGQIGAMWTPASSALMTWGANGPGRWVTLEASPAHVYAYVAGLRFDTHAMAPGDGATGIGWHTVVRTGAGFTTRHPIDL